MVMAVAITVVLVFLGIGILVSIHQCILARALRRSLNSRKTAASSSVSVNGGGMSQEEVQKLPSFEYKHGGMYIVLDRMLCKDDDGARKRNCMNRIDNGLWVDEFDCSECAVCLDGFQRDEKCRLLPVCRHTFHTKCVDPWLYQNPLCPICRTRVQQHGGERGTVVTENLLEVARVEGCEMGSGTRDIAIGVAVQGGVGGGWGSGFHQSEMSNLVSSQPPSPRSLATNEFVCNLMSTELIPSALQYRPDDGDGGVRAIDVLSHSESQNQNQNLCKLISTPIPSCRANDDNGTWSTGVLSSSQNQNQNSCDSMSITISSCRHPEEDGVRVNGFSVAKHSQYQNQIGFYSALSLPPHCRPPDDEGLRVIGVTCPDDNQYHQIQSQIPDGDAMA